MDSKLSRGHGSKFSTQGSSEHLKLPNAWVPQIHYMSTVFHIASKTEHAIRKAHYSRMTKGYFNPRNVVAQCAIAIANNSTQISAIKKRIHM